MRLEIRQVSRGSASAAVREQLVGLIHSRKVKVGEKLPPEKDLARSFGISRPVLREALESLRVMGLVTSQNGRGSFVASTNVGNLLLLGRYSASDLHEVRSFLEVPGARLAAKRRTDADITRLGSLLDALDSCGNPQEWVVLDAEFHNALAAASQNRVHARLVEDLRELLIEQSLALGDLPGRRMTSNREHRRIFRAVQDGREDAAGLSMRLHLRNVEYRVSKLSTSRGQKTNEEGS